MQELVTQRLKEIEQANNCRVLFACESGSRAWGFPSPDSDYDARFVYAHSIDWYLQIEDSKDTIEKMLPDDLDLAGWELRKTLKLFAGCNLSLNEWIGSPIFYNGGLAPELAQLKAHIPAFFNPKKAVHHYMSMATGIRTAEWSLDNSIKIKKLFYILRSLFASLWIAQNLSMPPTYFPEMLKIGLAPDAIESWIFELIHYKETAIEGEVIQVPDFAAQWISQAMDAIASRATEIPAEARNGKLEDLNQLLRSAVK
ncbi:MAG: nucleotidyltransferase domain-containing protein [Opitutaceae bacterium]